MVKDLEDKSIEDENRVRDMNVVVENLNMNVSLNQRTVIGNLEDHKELIDAHTKEIDDLKNKEPFEMPAMPEMKGDGLDMGELMKLFACKTPPDNTIKRIEALEKELEDVKKRLANQKSSTIVTNVTKESNDAAPASSSEPLSLPFDADDLLQRVRSLEDRADKSDRRFDKHEGTLDDHERRIKALEGMDFGSSGPAPVVTGELDTASILKQLKLVQAEQSSMRTELNNYKQQVVGDLEALRLELKGYTDKEVQSATKSLNTKFDSISEKLGHELERLRAEFENHKNKDFKDLEARVAALEKKFMRLQDAFANLKIPEAQTGGVSQEAFDALVRRVDDLEM